MHQPCDNRQIGEPVRASGKGPTYELSAMNPPTSPRGRQKNPSPRALQPQRCSHDAFPAAPTGGLSKLLTSGLCGHQLGRLEEPRGPISTTARCAGSVQPVNWEPPGTCATAPPLCHLTATKSGLSLGATAVDTVTDSYQNMIENSHIIYQISEVTLHASYFRKGSD